MLFITATRLITMNACHQQVALFRKLHPHGARVTRENLQGGAKSGLDVAWFGTVLFSYPDRFFDDRDAVLRMRRQLDEFLSRVYAANTERFAEDNRLNILYNARVTKAQKMRVREERRSLLRRAALTAFRRGSSRNLRRNREKVAVIIWDNLRAAGVVV